MDERLLPPEHAGAFLWIRRGVPIGLSLAGLALALSDPSGRGWYLLFSVACLAEVWPTFRSGEAYLRARPTSIRRDAAWVRAFRPLARLLGREEAWILSFCEWNNRNVRNCFQAHRARKALVLLPHCIQVADCKAQVLVDLEKCHRCGRCAVEDVLAGMLASRWECRINNRSHKTYREAREFKPDLMVAVACSDRLLKGLVKLPEVPAYVIPLSLPHGMCVDTTFSVSRLQAAMDTLVEPKGGREPRIQPLQRTDIA